MMLIWHPVEILVPEFGNKVACLKGKFHSNAMNIKKAHRAEDAMEPGVTFRDLL